MSGEIAALVSAVCYGLSNLLLKRGQNDTLPADNGLLPILVISGGILLFNMMFDVVDDPAPLIIGEAWGRSIGFCILSGISATLFGRLALYAAISRIGATRGSIIIAVAPLVTLIIAVLVLGETLYATDITGIAMLVCGIFALVLERELRSTKPMPRAVVNSGLLIAAMAATFQGLGYSFRKVGADLPIDPIFAATLDTWAALILYLIILGMSGRLRSSLTYYVRHPNLNIIASGFVMAAAIFLFFHAVSLIPVSTVSVIMGSQPVIVAFFSSILIRRLERLTWITVASSMLVSVGVVFLGWH